MSGFICHSIAEDCYNFLDSYGEICVGCGCCEKCKDEKRRMENRIAVDLRHLEENACQIDHPDFQLPIQQKNIRLNVVYELERIMESMEVLERIAGGTQ